MRAAGRVQTYPSDNNVYVGVGLTSEQQHPMARVQNASATGILALLADIDIRSAVHRKPNLPPDLPSAYKLVDAIARQEFDSPRGRFRFDPRTHNVIQPFIYVREVKEVAGGLNNVVIDKIADVRDPGTGCTLPA